MQTARLCTEHRGTQWGWGGQEAQMMFACKLTDMQVYSNTYRCMCSNQSYHVGGIYMGSTGALACKQKFGYRQ